MSVKKPITSAPRRGETLFEVIERRVVGDVVYDPESDTSPIQSGFAVAAAELEAMAYGEGRSAEFEFTFEGVTFRAGAKPAEA